MKYFWFLSATGGLKESAGLKRTLMEKPNLVPEKID
jgi:hypothetical protein